MHNDTQKIAAAEMPRANPADTLDRVKVMLDEQSAAAWQVFNVLAFMAEALPDDMADALPVRQTLFNLRDRQETLATNLGDLVSNAEYKKGENSNG